MKILLSLALPLTSLPEGLNTKTRLHAYAMQRALDAVGNMAASEEERGLLHSDTGEVVGSWEISSEKTILPPPPESKPAP